MRALGLPAPESAIPHFLQAHGGVQLALAAILVVVVALAEETVFRGYLILRLLGVEAPPRLAVAASAAVFALGHGYEGAARLATVAAIGVVFGAIYRWRGSLVAPAVMHFLLDMIGIVLLPLLGGW